MQLLALKAFDFEFQKMNNSSKESIRALKQLTFKTVKICCMSRYLLIISSQYFKWESFFHTFSLRYLILSIYDENNFELFSIHLTLCIVVLYKPWFRFRGFRYEGSSAYRLIFRRSAVADLNSALDRHGMPHLKINHLIINWHASTACLF